LVVVVDCFQEMEEGAAGAEMAPACFGFEVASSVWDEIEQNKNIRRGARARGGVRGREKVQNHLQASNSTRRAVVLKVFPARNRGGLAAR
jgi:hypothetical protein